MRNYKNSFTALLFFFSTFTFLRGQTLQNQNQVFVDYIKSVRFHVDGLFLSQPIVELGGDAGLYLSFDDLEGDVKDYFYTIVHCDKNWEPSGISEMEYLDGFANERLDNYDFSFKTIANYTRYQLFLPNGDLSWKISGNYLLIVSLEDGNEKVPVLMRRFVVVEPLVAILPNMVSPSIVSKSRTHQEIDFIVDHERLPIRNPRVEITATVLQNGRWDNAIYNIQPYFTKLNQLVFDYQDKVVFPAGKEFRYLDMRSLKFLSENIAQIDRDPDVYRVVLYKDQARSNITFFTQRDANGNFIFENRDQNSNSDLICDYAEVLFSLSTDIPSAKEDVYIMGGFTDWRLDPAYKMVYNHAVNAYVGVVKLKQGFYDYGYVTVPANKTNIMPSNEPFEGDWYETENNYTILVYYRPFGERYDRVIGFINFSSTL